MVVPAAGEENIFHAVAVKVGRVGANRGVAVLVTGAKGGEGAGIMFEMWSNANYLSLFTAGGWILLTAVNLMLLSLIHNLCSITIYTIYKETGNKKWTLLASLLPVAMGFVVTFFVAQIWRVLGGVG